jgi:hypothetical protein
LFAGFVSLPTLSIQKVIMMTDQLSAGDGQLYRSSEIEKLERLTNSIFQPLAEQIFVPTLFDKEGSKATI